MIKQFPKKLIREKKYPRCHYTKKRGKLKPKKPYDSLQAAEDFIKKHHLVRLIYALIVINGILVLLKSRI